jgi:predicted N-formylglutamate amidohydrolase
VVVGDNEPYDGALAGDTVNRHATRRGLANALVEVRQDLVEDAAGAVGWARRLADAWAAVQDDPALARVEMHPTRTATRRR